MAKKKIVSKPVPSKKGQGKPASKKLPAVKSTIGKTRQKKVALANVKINVSSSKDDKRDKPAKFNKKSMAKKVKGLLGESKVREKKIKADFVKREKARKVRAQQRKTASNILGKTLKITNKEINKKVKKSSKTTRVRYKKTSAPRKRKYQNAYLEDLAVYKKKKLTKKDKEELKRVKKNLQNNRSRTVGKLKDDIVNSKKKTKKAKKLRLTKKATNKLYKKEIDLSVAIKRINLKLGIGKALDPVTKRKISVKKQKVKVKVKKKGKKTVEKEVTKIIKKEVLPIWEGREKLGDLLKTKQFDTYVINGGSFTRQQQPELFLEFSKMEIRVRQVGVSTPHVIFYQRITDKICEISEYSY